MKLNNILILVSIGIIILMIVLVLLGFFLIWFFHHYGKQIKIVEDDVKYILNKIDYFSFLGVKFSKKISNIAVSISAIIRKFVDDANSMEVFASGFIKKHLGLLRAGLKTFTFFAKLIF